MPERKHMSYRRGKSFQQDRLWLPDAAVTRWLFLPFSPGAAGPNRDTFAPKYRHFVAPLLHSLKHFTTRPDVSALPIAAAPPSAVRCILQQNSSVRILEWSWQLNIPLCFRVNVDAATVKHRTYLFFFFLLRPVLISMVVLPGLQMHLRACLLPSTTRIFQDKIHFWNQGKSWASVMQIQVDGSAASVWFWFDDLTGNFKVFTVHIEGSIF